MNPNCLLFSQRERERESEKMSRRSPVVRGWSGCAMVLVKLSFQCRGVLLIWIIVGKGPIALTVQGFFWQFWEGALGPFRLGKLAL